MVEAMAYEINSIVEDTKAYTICHKKFGHVSQKGIKMLVSKGTIPNLKHYTSEFCKPCVLGK